jgi:hypothetical protein
VWHPREVKSLVTFLRSSQTIHAGERHETGEAEMVRWWAGEDRKGDEGKKKDKKRKDKNKKKIKEKIKRDGKKEEKKKNGRRYTVEIK